MKIIDKRTEKKEYTFNNLDPATDYYYAVRSHYRTTFSDPDIKPVDVLPTPIVADATSITDKSFVANWGNVINADVYKVNLYGVYQAKEDIEGFVLFEENFDKTSNLTTSTNIINPRATASESIIFKKCYQIFRIPGSASESLSHA